MKKWILLVIALCLGFQTPASAQFYSYFMGGSSIIVSDTLIADTPDTTEKFNLYPSSVMRRIGDPCFEIMMTDIGTNTTHDSLEVELWVSSRDNPGKDSNGWIFVKQYNFYGISKDQDVLVVADTLQYISSRYAHLILSFLGGDAADSTAYYIYLVGDKGASP